jgi:sarcosine oxidase, subunit alpha
MGSRRLETGGIGIDRGAPLRFRFDGRAYEGLEGDTLASALLANGVDVVCPSPILGRPRGVHSAGVEEAAAFVAVIAPRPDPIVAATTVELVDGMVAEGRPGVGRLPADAAGSVGAEHRHAHVETLVVGGGPAGIAAARDAAERGDRLMLVDERHWLGGTGETPVEAEPWRAAPDTAVLLRATATGVYDMGYVVVYERARPVARVWHVRAGRVILATGAHERPIAFADCDRPGVMLAGAAQLYAQRFGVLPGERAVVFTTNHGGYDAAFALADAGVTVAAVVDVGPGGRAADHARARGIEVRTRSAVTGTDGATRVSAVHVAGPGGATATIDADLLLVSGGWNPALQLWRAIGGGLRYDADRACFVPDGNGPDGLSAVGAASGDVPASVPFWFTPAEDLSRHYVDLQRDSTVADVIDALGHDLRSVEHIKRATYIGTAVDQGRTSGVLTAEIVNQLMQAGPGAQGPTNARPPYTPIPFVALAGLDRGRLIDPARVTPIHPWHVEHDAVFENVGQWLRPWYFPRDGEGLDEAVHRECLAVRNAVGVMDASTLGKIEVRGPDAATFLDRIYTNAISTLKVGSIRYSMMLGLDGMVFDDGVVMRLDDDRFLLTTTTGGAARALDHLEEWLQCEWLDLRAYCTSVTEQWSTIAVNGPRARDLLGALGTDVELSAEAFPWMTWRDGRVAGIDARVARVSFSGELAYEINVAGTDGIAMWEAVMAAGGPLGLAPYGTESMHVLRGEKGFVIVGQETDGTTTPDDLGMAWIVNPSKGDFIGKRSLVRPDTVRPDRKQLVGLLAADPDALIPEGAQVLREPTDAIPAPMLGHVTSSYHSPILGRTIALAMLKGGRGLTGDTVHAATAEGTFAAEVGAPVFYDPEGSRRDG